MKRLLIIFSLALLLALSGCGGQEAGAEQRAAEAAVNADTPGLKLSQTSTVSKEKYLGEADFEDFLSRAQKGFVIPGLNEGLIPQGMACSEQSGLIYISGYYSADLPSVITAVDAETHELCAEYFLYHEDGSAFPGHVGGLAAVGDTLYVSAALDNDGSYAIAALPIDALTGRGSFELTVSSRLAVPVSPSFLNCSGGYLWLGNFYHPSAGYELPPLIGETTEGFGCYILGYDAARDLTEESGDYLVPDLILAAPDRIQGVCYADGRLLLSQSYGRRNNSALYEYALDPASPPDSTFTLAGREIPVYILRDSRLLSAVTAMPMTEAVCAMPTGGTLVLFESGALHYSDGKFRTDCVWLLDG